VIDRNLAWGRGCTVPIPHPAHYRTARNSTTMTTITTITTPA
jgi:hypothetical protein